MYRIRSHATALGFAEFVLLLLAALPAIGQVRFEGSTRIRWLEQHRTLGLRVEWVDAQTEDDGTATLTAHAIVASADPELRSRELSVDRIEHRGGFILHSPAGEVSLVGFALVRTSEEYELELVDSGGRPWLLARMPHHDRGHSGQDLSIRYADLVIGHELALHLRMPELEGFLLGELGVELTAPRESSAVLIQSSRGDFLPAECGPSFGPPVDVALTSLSNPLMLFREPDTGRVALAPSAELVNVGDNAVEWGRSMKGITGAIPSASRAAQGWIGQHPYLVLNMYRIVGDVIEQIGLSDVKHTFLSLNQGCACQSGQLLGVGCGDVYSSTTNNDPKNFTPRDEVTANTGSWTSLGSHRDVDSDDVFSHPTTQDPEIDELAHRLVVEEIDLMTPGATYFVDGWYIVRGDSNIFNSMAHLRVTPIFFEEVWNFIPLGGPSVQGSILDVLVDPASVSTDRSNNTIDTGAGHLQLTGIATDNENGTFTYEYALMNHDYDAQVEGFRVPLPLGAVATDPMFREAGEVPGPAWVATVGSDAVEWLAPSGAALDWGRLVGFSIVVDQPPVTSAATLYALETSDQHTIEVTGVVMMPEPDFALQGLLAVATVAGLATRRSGTRLRVLSR